MTEGFQPTSNNDVNVAVGNALRTFVMARDQIHRMHADIASLTLTAAPYSFSAQQAADITTALTNLDTSLQAIDMTFIDRLVGLF